jgi:6-phosphogluconolactonase
VLAAGPPELARAAAAAIAAHAEATLAGHARFRIALAGGSTPRAIYPALVDMIDWSRAEVFFGDERAVPPADPQSNYRMARETLLDPARVSPARVFRWRAEDADLDAAARDYERALRATGGPPWLDLALLGLGPDGHTASLFPGTAALAEEQRLAVAVDVAEKGTRRLTLTYPAFRGTRAIFFMVAGREKAQALADALRPDSALPAARVLHGRAPVTVFCDQDAASLLPAHIAVTTS